MSSFGEIGKQLFLRLMGLSDDDWIQWLAMPNGIYDDCDKFDKCVFICKQMPDFPQHPNCMCTLKKVYPPIPNQTAFANCDIRKFTEYIFVKNNSKGKYAFFTNMGYSIDDSEFLVKFYTEQALQKYCTGEYIYKGTTDFCVKIEIVINLPTSYGTIEQVKTGWALLPNGNIRLITPFSGIIHAGDL